MRHLALVLLLVFVMGIVLGCGSSEKTTPTLAPTLTPTVTPTPMLSQMLQEVIPSIVRISTTDATGTSTGTGFAAFQSGQILTAFHVVGDVHNRPTVRTQDGTEYNAVVFGADEERDLALLIVLGLNITPLTFASSVSVGDSAIAVGYAAGLSGEPSVTQGIISGKRVESDTGLTFLQTDAPINPGNSGGPLFNSFGQVVGVNVSVLRGSAAQYENMGFAIPIDEVSCVSSFLLAGSIKLLPTPTPTPTPALEVWKTYTNQTYGYSIQIPSGSKVGKTVRQVVSGEIIESDDSSIHITAIGVPGNIHVEVDESVSQSLDELVSSSITEQRTHTIIFQLLGDRQAIHQGLPVREVEYLAQLGNGGKYWYYKWFFIKSGATIYQVLSTSTQSDYDQCSSVFDHTFSSFTLASPTEPWTTYTNTTYGYSIQYPNSGHVSKIGKKLASGEIIEGDDSSISIHGIGVPGSISVDVSEAVYESLDGWVNSNILGQKTHSNSFQMLADRQVIHQGLPASEIEYLVQYRIGDEYRHHKCFFVKNGSTTYLVTMDSTQSDYDHCSPIFDYTFASFTLANP